MRIHILPTILAGLLIMCSAPAVSADGSTPSTPTHESVPGLGGATTRVSLTGAGSAIVPMRILDRNIAGAGYGSETCWLGDNLPSQIPCSYTIVAGLDLTLTFSLPSGIHTASLSYEGLDVDGDTNKIYVNGHDIGLIRLAEQWGDCQNWTSDVRDIGTYVQSGTNYIRFEVNPASWDPTLYDDFLLRNISVRLEDDGVYWLGDNLPSQIPCPYTAVAGLELSFAFDLLGDAPIALLSYEGLDVDGDTNKIYVNGHDIGLIRLAEQWGNCQNWTTDFRDIGAYVQPGTNYIRFEVNPASWDPTLYDDFLLRNVSVELPPVAVEATSWGAIKARYR